MVEAIALSHEELLEKYLEEGDLSEEELLSGIRDAAISGEMVPVLCGTSYKNKGVQLLLDAMVNYLPSPLEVPAIKGVNPDTEKEEERKSSESEPFAALAFKVMADPYVGKLVFLRVYSGKVAKGASILNTNNGKKERIGRILQMHANSREDIDDIYAGDIVAASRA